MLPSQLQATLETGAVAAGVPLPLGFPTEALGRIRQFEIMGLAQGRAEELSVAAP